MCDFLGFRNCSHINAITGFEPDSRVVYILLIRPSPKTSRDLDEPLQIAHVWTLWKFLWKDLELENELL